MNAFPLRPGDGVLLARGAVWKEPLRVTRPGTKALPILISAYGTGIAPIVRHLGTGDGTASVTIESSFVIVDVLAKNYAHDLKMLVSDPKPNNDHGATMFNIWGSSIDISNNKCVRCSAPSIDYGRDGGFLELYAGDGPMSDIQIHHNASFDGDGFMEIGGPSTHLLVKNVAIHHNVSKNDGDRFAYFHVRPGAGWSVPIQAFTIDQNTIVSLSSDPPHASTVLAFDGEGADQPIQFRNNIVEANHWITKRANPSFVRHHNIYFMHGSAFSDDVLKANEKVVDPKWIDAAVGNYTLRPESPARNAGVNLGYTLDHNFHPSPRESVADIGAFEYQP